MQNIAKEASEMIKKSIEARDKMKDEYDKAIKDLVGKYEKQIQYMKLVIVQQNKKYEKQIEDLKSEKKYGKNDLNDIGIEDDEKKIFRKIKKR